MIVLHLLLNLAGLFLFFLTLPLVIELAVLTASAIVFALRYDFLRTVPAPALAPPVHAAPALIVIIPAHNEAQLIARTVTSLKDSAANAASANPLIPIRLVVIAHNSTDATAANAKQAGAEVLELNDITLNGKGNALLYGFTKLAPPTDDASHTAFVIIDADTLVAPELLRSIQQAIAAGADAVQCRYEAIQYSDDGNRKASLAALAFRAFNVVRARGRAQLGLSCGLFGNGFALRANLLSRVPYNAHSVVEDLEYHIALLRNNIRVHYLDHARLRGEITGSRSQQSRWDGGRARMANLWLGPLVVDVIRYGRLRMLGPIFYLASLPLAQGVLLLLLELALPLHWLRVAAAFSLLIVFLHVAIAILAGEHPTEDLKLFQRLPIYFIAKLTALPAMLRMTRHNADWVRTKREIPTEDKDASQ